MSKQLYKILWSLAILAILITTMVFSFGIIIMGAVTISLYGIYRNYFPRKKRSANKFSRSQVHPYGEVIDIKSEVIHQTIETKITK